MFDPDGDLTVLQNLFAEDDRILELLGMTGASPAQIAKAIIKRDSWDDMPGNEKRICIYFQPSMDIRNELCSREILRIDAHVPAVESHIAYRIITRIHQLLHNKKHGKALLRSIGQYGQRASMPGFFCAAMRFKYYITK